MPPEPLVSLKNINVFNKSKHVLQDITLNILPREFITIVGPNGAGKSTLIKIIAGILKPNNGSISKKSKINIGYVPQKIYLDQSIPITVTQFLNLLRKNSSEQILEIAKQLKITSLLHNQLSSLSGGEMQFVMLARALLNKPHILLLDEPDQNLDIGKQLKLYKIINNIQKSYNCAILLVSHDLHLVMANTTKVLCLYHHICCHGKPEHISKEPSFQNIFGQNMSDMFAIYQHHHNHIHKS